MPQTTVADMLQHRSGGLRAVMETTNFDFAVGFSRQPLPTGNRFAVVTNTMGAGIKATDATRCCGLELAKLRPETLEPVKAKLPPTANVFSPGTCAGTLSTPAEARAGFETNHKRGETKAAQYAASRRGIFPLNQSFLWEAHRVANVPCVLLSRGSP